MTVVITYKYKDIIAGSELKSLDYKTATGYFSARAFVADLKKLNVSKLIIDITAVRDINERITWERFMELVPADKIFILLDQNKQYSNVEFFVMLIELGIYNFAKTPAEIKELIDHPNIYEDVYKILVAGKVAAEKRETASKKFEGYSEKHEEQKQEMKRYVHQSQEEGFGIKEKPKVFSQQIKTGLMYLPLLTIIMVLIFYLLTLFLYGLVDSNSYLGEYLFSEMYNTDVTPIMGIGIIVSIFVYIIYFVGLEEKIKRKQATRSKFIILPFAIYTSIFFLNYHILGIFNKILIIEVLEGETLFVNFDAYAAILTGLAILIYYFRVLIYNSTVVVFEEDLSERLNMMEIIFCVLLFIMLGVPLANAMVSAFAYGSSFQMLLASISGSSVLMLTMFIAAFIMMLMIIWQALTVPNRNYKTVAVEEIGTENKEEKEE